MDTSASVPAEERTSGTLTYALLAIVIVVAAIFALNSGAVPDHWYGLFKAVHVTFAVLWVGGGTMITILAIVAERSDDPLQIANVARQAATVGEKFFAPVGLVTFLMGLAMMFNTNWGWGKFWVVVGLIGYAATFAIGIALIAPTVKKLHALIEANGPTHPDSIALIKRVMLIARVDTALLLIVGLIGYAATFAIGIALIAPTVKKLHALIEANGPTHPDSIALIKRVMLIARVDTALLLIVVLDMVTKPFA